MTGTPLDLTPFGPLLSVLGLLYWVFALGAAGLVTWLLRSQSWWLKTPLVAAVLAAFIYPVATHVREERQQHDEGKAKLDAAMALFQERCKGAGEKVNRIVENIDGVVWMKWRPNEINLNDQFKLDDPYGKDCDGAGCIADLLRVTRGAELNPEEAERHSKGYRFVETTDPSDGRKYRYVGVIKSVATRTADEIEQYKQNSHGRDPGPDVYGFAVQREPITAFTARYGITWDDLSTPEDREHWIAGGAMKAIDLQTNEVIAERVGYLMDSGQGSQAGFRSPWGWATSHGPRCPRLFERSWDFATKTIRPKMQGE